jgi:hypothetical protein
MSTSIYYVYQYLREDGTPYYIGKGKGDRAYGPHRISVPNDVSRIVIIKDNMTEEEAFVLEQELILKYGRKDLGTGVLRNLTNGGEGTSGMDRSGENGGMYGKSHTEEARKKISQTRKQKAIPSSRKGVKLSEETKKKLSEARKGKPLSEETKLKLSARFSGENNPMYGKRFIGSANHFYGKKHSEETKRKISETKKKRNN